MNLVFASGFLFPQRLSEIVYFRDVEAHVKAGGHTPIFPAVPPTASREERARVLADKIQEAFPEGPVHIIGHSMGGLDGRTLIARNHHGLSDPGRIASLTTLSTPHGGSPVADLLTGPRPLISLVHDAVAQVVEALGIPTGALKDLTAKEASKVPDVAVTHAHIRYRSYFASGREGPQPTSIILLPTHFYVRSQKDEPNDGLVTMSSARYGEFQEPTWRCDHADMMGHDLDNLDLGDSRFAHLEAIDGIISKLEQAA